MFGLDDILGGISGVAGVINAFGAARRLKEAQDARDRMLNDIGSNLSRQYQQTQEGNLQALRRNTGLLGDSLQATGSDLGGALARAGVTNSSATAGALTKGAATNAATLAGEAQQNFNSEQQLLSQNQDQLNRYKLGVNQWGAPTGQGIYGDLNDAKAGAAGAFGSLATLGGSLSRLFTPNPQVQTPTGMTPPIAEPNGGGLGTTTNPLGLNSNFLGSQTGGGLAGAAQGAINPGQSFIQTRAAQLGAGVGSPMVQNMSPRNNGPMMNGNQGSTLLNGYKRLY